MTASTETNATLSIRGSVFCLVLIVTSAIACACADEVLPTNQDPARQIRFQTVGEADARRQRLIRFIWSDGLPTNVLPAVARDLPRTDQVMASDLNRVDLSLAARIDRIVVDVAGWDFLAKTYLLYPEDETNLDRLVVVHAGHVDDLGSGIAATANLLLSKGFTVGLSHMPLSGWNDDSAGVLPDGSLFGVSRRGTSGHDDLFEVLAEEIGGATFRLFLEPAVQTINQFIHELPAYDDISMIGLSGGGWTTHMMAAVDTRIRISVPVAGSSPLYVRNQDERSYGDAEQRFGPLYDEDIGADGSGGGVATWLEIYALGGYGEGRWQTMVTNEQDWCCFSGRFADSFKQIVANCVEEDLGQGGWTHFLDSTHDEHQISEVVLLDVIGPLLGF